MGAGQYQRLWRPQQHCRLVAGRLWRQAVCKHCQSRRRRRSGPAGTTGAWDRVATGGFGDASNVGIDRLTEFNGQLYAGTWVEDGSGAQIWRTPSGNAGSWSQVAQGGLGSTNNSRVHDAEPFDGYMYAGTLVTDPAPAQKSGAAAPAPAAAGHTRRAMASTITPTTGDSLDEGFRRRLVCGNRQRDHRRRGLANRRWRAMDPGKRRWVWSRRQYLHGSAGSLR